MFLVKKLQAFYQVTVLLILNFNGREILHLEHYDDNRATKVKNTLIFNAFVFCQVSLFPQIKRDKWIA